MADVAARAGVSHQTVSRVINGHPSVAPHTRERVRAGDRRARLPAEPRGAGAGHRVHPHHRPGHGQDQPVRPGADDARAGEGRTRGRLLAERLDPGRRHRRGHAGRRRPLRRPVGRRDRRAGTYDDAAEALRTLDAAGAAGRRPGRRRRGSPGRRRRPGGRRAAGHPAPAGRSATARCTTSPGPADSQEARGRIAGWRAELEAAGAPVPEPLRGDWTPSSGYAAGRSWPPGSARGDGLTAVFLANDQMALGLLAALHEEGLAVPGRRQRRRLRRPARGAVLHAPADHGPPGLRRARAAGRPAGARPAGGEDLHPDPVPAPLIVRASTGPAGLMRAAAGLTRRC